MIRRMVRMADREWIRVGWSGSQTVRHRLLACTPMILLGLLALAIESVDYGAAGLLIFAGIVLSGFATLTFEWRRMAALGNARRSERVLRASKRT